MQGFCRCRHLPRRAQVQVRRCWPIHHLPPERRLLVVHEQTPSAFMKLAPALPQPVLCTLELDLVREQAASTAPVYTEQL